MVSLVSGTFKGSESLSGRGFKVEFDRSGVGPAEALEQEGIVLRGASVEAVVKTATAIKERIRDFIDAHFGGSTFTRNGRRRVANASAQVKFYDELESKGQYAGLVYSKFGKRDAGGFVDFLLLHMRGGTLEAHGGGWLKISAAGMRGDLARTGSFADAGTSVFFRPSKDGTKLFMFRKRSGIAAGGALQLIATLVKAVTIPASLSGIEAIARQRPELFEGYFGAAVDRLRQQEVGKA
jgi:hypothetical protein